MHGDLGISRRVSRTRHHHQSMPSSFIPSDRSQLHGHLHRRQPASIVVSLTTTLVSLTAPLHLAVDDQTDRGYSLLAR